MSIVTTSIADPPVTARSPLISWLAVISVMMGIFSIVTTEILPIGLLTPIGSSFHLSDGTAGLMMTTPGILAAVSAPLVTVATGRFDRRSMLCALLLLLALANFLAAFASAYWVLALSRVIVGVTIGGFWSIGAGLAARLVRREQISTATAVIFSAVPLGSVLGVPAGTLIGHLAGWRTAFVVIGVLTTAVFVSLIVLLPPLPAEQVTRLHVLRDLFHSRTIRIGLLVTFLVVFAHFGAYTYVTPFLQQVTQVSPKMITTYLLVYGIAGIAGNFAAGRMATRSLWTTFSLAAGILAGATLLLPVVGRSDLGAVVVLVAWGLAYGAVPYCSQTWFARSAGNRPEAAAVLFTSSFQATISVGALAGGAVVDSLSTSAVMALGGVIALLAVMTVLTLGRADRRPS